MMGNGKGNFTFNDVTVTEGGRIFWKKKLVEVFRKNGTPVRSTGVHARLVKVFIKRPYELVSLEELSNQVLGGQFTKVKESYISRQIDFLRYSFEKVDPEFKALESVWHEGVVWNDGRLPFLKLLDVPEIQINDFEIRWNGQTVDLSHSQRKLVIALLARRGTPISSLELYNLSRPEKLTEIGRREKDILKTSFHTIRQKFLAIDPAFNSIRTTADGSRVWTISGTTLENLHQNSGEPLQD